MTLQKKLAEYEHRLEHFSGWTSSTWPSSGANPVGMRVDRLTLQMENREHLMLHRFSADKGSGHIHPHEYALAAHVLGPGTYEVSFITGGITQNRIMCDESFYYEMVTPKLQHCVRPLSDPIYSVAIWSSFPNPRDLHDRLIEKSLRSPEKLIPIIENFFINDFK